MVGSSSRLQPLWSASFRECQAAFTCMVLSGGNTPQCPHSVILTLFRNKQSQLGRPVCSVQTSSPPSRHP